MKKQRPPRPKHKARPAARPAQVASSTTGSGPARSPSLVPGQFPTTKQLSTATRKEGTQSDAKVGRPATLPEMTTARGWKIFIGVLCAICLVAIAVSLFATVLEMTER